MKFDSNRAWKDASAAVSANREVLLAFAGVFFLLPSLAVALLLPQPEAPAGATPEQAMNIMRAYYASSLPYILPMTIVQAAGTLGLLSLFTDRRRPTVGEAIKLGFVGLLPYIAAQMLIGIAVGVVGGLLMAIGAATGAATLVTVLVVLAAVGLAYVLTKTSLAAPVIMVEGVRNPVTALTRSWMLTKGNSLRLALFYFLLLLVFIVLTAVVMGVIGLITAVVAGGEAGRVVSAVVSSGLGAVMTLYFIAALAAAHRQLAGDSPDRIGATFE